MDFYGKDGNYWFESGHTYFAQVLTGQKMYVTDSYDNMDTAVLRGLFAILYGDENIGSRDWTAVRVYKEETRGSCKSSACVREYKTLDELLEDVWKTLTDVNIDEGENIEQDWFIFEAGTSREYLWHWFDEHYSKGVAELMYGDEERE